MSHRRGSRPRPYWGFRDRYIRMTYGTGRRSASQGESLEQCARAARPRWRSVDLLHERDVRPGLRGRRRGSGLAGCDNSGGGGGRCSGGGGRCGGGGGRCGGGGGRCGGGGAPLVGRRGGGGGGGGSGHARPLLLVLRVQLVDLAGGHSEAASDQPRIPEGLRLHLLPIIVGPDETAVRLLVPAVLGHPDLLSLHHFRRPSGREPIVSILLLALALEVLLPLGRVLVPAEVRAAPLLLLRFASGRRCWLEDGGCGGLSGSGRRHGSGGCGGLGGGGAGSGSGGSRLDSGVLGLGRGGASVLFLLHYGCSGGSGGSGGLTAGYGSYVGRGSL